MKGYRRGHHVVARYKIDDREEFFLASFYFSDPKRAAWERDQLQLREERMRFWTGPGSRVRDFRYVVETVMVQECPGDEITREVSQAIHERVFE